MFLDVHEVSILVATLLAIAVGSIWYSPLLFGKYWMEATGITEAGLSASKQQLAKLFLTGFVAHLVLFFVLAQFNERSILQSESIWPVATLLALMLGSAMAVATVWEQRSFSYFAINVGYMIVAVYGGIAVISYWPW